MEFIKNYGGTIAVAIIIALIVSFIIRKLIRDRKNGKSGCGCGCENCAMGDVCKKPGRKENN